MSVQNGEGNATAPEAAPCAENLTMLEAFEWYTPADHQHWHRLRGEIPKLKRIGIDNIWLPPGCKAGWKGSNGYDIYDLYDLGEFDQKGAVETKWGTKGDLVEMMGAAREEGVGVYWDAVLGHKAAADRPEKCQAVPVHPADRRRAVGKAREIEAWVGYDYVARGGRYSGMRYDARHFNGVDYDNLTGKKGIWKILGDDGEKDWAEDVDKENGNADYLLCGNVDVSREDVREDSVRWARWIGHELGLAGFRIDAAKHLSRGFTEEFVRCLDPSWTVIAEYAQPIQKTLTRYIDCMKGRVYVFDFVLRENFVRVSNKSNAGIDQVLDGSVVEARPENSVTFVTNHDTQEREQDPSALVAPFFVPLAYALILLSKSGGYPCVFYGDLYGVNGPNEPKPPVCSWRLPKLILARKLYAYGPEHVYKQDRYCLGFTRLGHPSRSNNAGVAVLMTKGERRREVEMYVGKHHAGELWTDILDEEEEKSAGVKINGEGWGRFIVLPQRVSVWIDSEADGRDKLDALEFYT